MDFKENSPPGLALISGYGEGGFRIGRERHEGHLLICQTGTFTWAVKSIKLITKQSLKPVFEGDFRPEFLLFGLGTEVADQVLVSRQLAKLFGLPAEVMTTGAAARTYNVLTLEGRLVAAALWAV